MMSLSQASFDKTVELVATRSSKNILDISDALHQRIADAKDELETKQHDVLISLRNMKKQLTVLKQKKNKIETEEIPYLSFQLQQSQIETKESAAQTLYVEKIRIAHKKVQDIETKIRQMHARIRKISRSPNLIQRYIGDLQEEMLVVANAIKIIDYLSQTGLRFGDLRASDLTRMFNKLRWEGEL